MELNRSHISALARLLSSKSDMKHTKAISEIAKVLGYTDGNALMGTLKSQETNQTPSSSTDLRTIKAAGEKETAGYLYMLTFPYISDDPTLDTISLQDLAYEVQEGGSVGAWGEDMVITKTPVSRKTLGELATRFGSSPDFFFEEEEDEDPHISQAFPPDLLLVYEGNTDFHGDSVADLLSSLSTLLFYMPTLLLKKRGTADHKKAQKHLIEAETAYNEEGDDLSAIEEIKAALDCLVN